MASSVYSISYRVMVGLVLALKMASRVLQLRRASHVHTIVLSPIHNP